MLQLSTKFFMDDRESCSEISSSRNSWMFSEDWFKGWVVSKVSKERSLMSRRIVKVVKSKFSKGEIVNPVILLIRAVCTEVHLQGLISTFCESVGLWVISCRGLQLNL